MCARVQGGKSGPEARQRGDLGRQMRAHARVRGGKRARVHVHVKVKVALRHAKERIQGCPY